MRVRPILTVLGAMLALVGLVWIGQGLDYIAWPASSAMLGVGVWADRGAGVAVLGLLLILLARRL